MARCRAPPAGVPSRLLHASQRLGLALLLTLISVTLTKDKRQELPDRDAGAADRAGSVGQEVGVCVCVRAEGPREQGRPGRRMSRTCRWPGHVCTFARPRPCHELSRVASLSQRPATHRTPNTRCPALYRNIRQPFLRAKDPSGGPSGPGTTVGRFPVALWQRCSVRWPGRA